MKTIIVKSHKRNGKVVKSHGRVKSINKALKRKFFMDSGKEQMDIGRVPVKGKLGRLIKTKLDNKALSVARKNNKESWGSIKPSYSRGKGNMTGKRYNFK